MIKLKQIIYLIRRFLLKRTEEGKIKILREMGCKVGDRCRFNCDLYFVGTEPYLVEIGENCLFASGCHLMNHDGGVKVLNALNYFGDGKRYDKMGRIKIGNNVYVGMNSIILGNVSVGDNVIIGANSIVTKNIPSNSVAVGIPAKVISTIDEYYHKNLDRGNFYAIRPDKREYLIKNVKKLK